MDTTGQLFQISKFPDTLSFAIIPGVFFGENLTKVGQNYINNKFAQSGRIPPKIAKNSRHARRLSRLLKLQINRTMAPPGVNDDGNYMKDEPHHKRLPSNQRKIDVFGLWRLEVTLQSRSFAYQLEYVSIKALCGRSIFYFFLFGCVFSFLAE